LQLLSRGHDRSAFDCGREAQNLFLKERARKHAELNYSKTWVAVEEGQAKILGFVTLSMGNIVFETLQDELSKRLPKYPMPVLHVGQLATDRTFQGKGIGSLLLRFAAEQAIAASKTVGCYAIELVADNDAAREFYVSRGFVSISPGSMKLYQTIGTLLKAQ
jgi:GNAT superfamily N-acetyltransferase